MKALPSLLRIAEHDALAKVKLFGTVLDIGGDARGEYLKWIQGEFSTTTVNLDPGAVPDIVHDLETPLPVESAAFDHALLINVLEHIFEYRQLISEAVRAVRPGGSIVIVVPFLFPLHLDPHDYWRFSTEALRKECERLGLKNIQIAALGSGVFAARYVMLDRILPPPLRRLSHYSVRYLVPVLDSVFTKLARVLGKKYLPSDYALGYCLLANTST
tara:strand:+ start:584420 stop:585067 length:648 start_codon:yes stop_codon:yes gene_type:complete